SCSCSSSTYTLACGKRCPSTGRSPLTSLQVESTVHSAGPWTLYDTAGVCLASASHSCTSIASPPTSSAANCSPPRPSPSPASSHVRNCPGVVSSTCTPCSCTYSNTRPASTRSSSLSRYSECPASNCTHCCTDASKLNDAFQPTRKPSPSSA